jgi:polysaccharide biosynthesis protein PelA
MQVRARLLLLVLLMTLGSALVSAHSAGAAPEAMPRTLLAIYDGNRADQPDGTLLHKLAEMPLNHLGFMLEYHDVRATLPSPSALRRYNAVITWFEAPVANAPAYLAWAANAAQAGTRFVILGESGGNPFSTDLPLINGLLSALGVRHTGHLAAPTHGTQVLKLDPAIMEFERPLDIALPPYPILIADGGKMEPALELKPSRQVGSAVSTVVATGPAGGYAATGYIHYSADAVDQVKWIINPFVFFRRALGVAPFPVPDITTISGRRIFFSHVNGDGWNFPTKTDGYHQSGTLAAEVLDKEVIAANPDLPVTVGLIAGDADYGLGGRTEARETAIRIFARPNVEIAVNTYTYPMVWGQITDRNGDGAASPSAINVRSQPHAMTRVYNSKPFQLSQEVTGAKALVGSMAPPGNHATVYLWSGDARPFGEAIAATRSAGMRNINGGGSRFDAAFPSLANVSAIARTVGPERQIYAVMRDTHPMVDSAGRASYGFASFAETVRNTGSPRRLAGVNLHYSVRVAERSSVLASIKRSIESVRTMQLAPIHTSEYAAIADGFFDTEIVPLGATRWLIRNRGALQTVRFDEAEQMELDPSVSDGAVGQSRHGGSLYIALDASVRDPVVALRNLQTGRQLDRTAPLLTESRWRVSAVVRGTCVLRYSANGFGQGDFHWSGVKPGAHLVAVTRNGQHLWSQEVIVAADMQLRFSAPITAIEPVDVEVRCRSTGAM